jgi:hypothetical protein
LSVLSPDYAFDFVSNVVIGVSFMAFMSCTSSAWSNASRTTIIAGQTSNRHLSNGHKTNAIFTPQVRVDIDNNTVTAHPHVLGTPFELSIAGPTLPYPLALSARSKNVYFIPREGFNLAGMFQNPVRPTWIEFPSLRLTGDMLQDDADDGSDWCNGDVYAEAHGK